jgi:3',5'-cyclic AMP phosphodiesterase CpdA
MRPGETILVSSFRFIFMADCQLGAYATFSGMTEEDLPGYAARDMRVEIVPRVEGFAWDAERYRSAIEMANGIRPEFVVMGGDMTDDAGGQEQVEELLRITASLDSSIPMLWVPGNHDIANDAEVPTPSSIAAYRDVFGSDFYGFDHGDVRFVVLNTVVIDHPEETEDELAEQLEFIEHELSQAAGRSHTILLGHHPLFLKAADEPDTYWNLPAERRAPLLEIIHRHGIKAAFAGHWHRNSLAYDGEFEMVTSGPVGYPLGDDPSGIRLVDVGPDQILHEYVPIV